MQTFEVYGKSYKTAADYRARNYEYARVEVQAEDEIEAERKASEQFFSFSLVSVKAVEDKKVGKHPYTWVESGEYYRLAGGEHVYRVELEFAEPIITRSEYTISSTAFLIVATSEHNAKMGARLSALEAYPGKTVKAFGEVRQEQDDVAICAHCGLVGGH